MKHTSLYLDEALLESAAEVLGTSGTTVTVRAALERVVRQSKLDALTQWEPELGPDELDRLRATHTG